MARDNLNKSKKKSRLLLPQWLKALKEGVRKSGKYLSSKVLEDLKFKITKIPLCKGLV